MSTTLGAEQLRRSVDRAIDWVAGNQSPTGELTSYASPLDGEPVWLPDSLKFITSLGAVALHEVPDPRAAAVVDRAVAFLRRERESGAQWRYWSQDNDQYLFTPPDADDTACASLAVATRGDRTRANVALLLRNRDPQGRFYTWLIPHRRPGLRTIWAQRDELRTSVRRHREELWSTTEAEPDDVDVVVNLNVARYLGRRTPTEVVRWITSVLHDDAEHVSDKWHRNRFTFYAALADAHRRGVPGLGEVAPLVVARICERIDGGSVGPAMDSALALLALQTLDGPSSAQEELAGALVAGQLDDGSWERSIFFYGGPKEVFGWASEALTTAWVLQALTRHVGTSGRGR
jgi:hypothetical protein